MHYEWLKQQSAKSMIVIFSGWGFSAEVFDHLLLGEDAEKYDVLFVSDYHQLSMQLPDLSHYQERFLIAWSFGVAAFSTWLATMPTDQRQSYSEQFDRFIAINGSMQPVDRYHGIPEAIMQKTIDTLSQASFEHFAARCLDDLPKPKDLQINVTKKKQELQTILARKHQAVSLWDVVWIANHDKIFPPKNLSRAWQLYNESCSEVTQIHYCDAPHAPFQLWSTWDQIISNSA